MRGLSVTRWMASNPLTALYAFRDWIIKILAFYSRCIIRDTFFWTWFFWEVEQFSIAVKLTWAMELCNEAKNPATVPAAVLSQRKCQPVLLHTCNFRPRPHHVVTSHLFHCRSDTLPGERASSEILSSKDDSTTGSQLPAYFRQDRHARLLQARPLLRRVSQKRLLSRAKFIGSAQRIHRLLVS